jgi:hypothetical protein
MLVGARLRHVAGTKWGSRRYLDLSQLDNEPKDLVDLNELRALGEQVRQEGGA